MEPSKFIELARQLELTFEEVAQELAIICDDPPEQIDSDQVFFALLRIERDLDTQKLYLLRQYCELAIRKLPDGDNRKLHFHRIKNVLWEMQRHGPGVLARFAHVSFTV